MSIDVPLTHDPQRWPHLEACYRLAREAARGFAPGACATGAFTAARWGLHMGLTLAKLDPDWAEEVRQQTEDYDVTRDGLEAATYARYAMMQDVNILRRMAQQIAEDGG